MTTLFDPATPILPAPASAGAGPRPLVIGIDPSLTSCGIAGADWADALRPRKTHNRGHLRLSWLRTEIADRTRAADLVVIEGPSYGHGAMAGHHEMAGLWWLIAHDLWRREIPYAVCPPSQRAMYATGKGNASKGMVRDGVRTHFGIECDGPGRYDQADAASMAHLGLHWLGYPTTELPPTHTRALGGVAWPEQTPVVAR
ncbi:hypothetical protein [Streptomyces sp. 35G-GA-8]|uniref:hypothetical protein n=1 Tax=Streptomyces sp. 35G-GA-8 TaxID=2939434 RepID=UPI00201EA24A|nr:hypothetical protein [Streptomyces sp. 35G-GA-8]MCL7377431.1 hypothetical protein [Streptomyces sp. 35G-GA-8]